MAAAFFTGVLIDLDHMVEYYWWFVKGDHTRVWYFLHSYELLVPAFLAGYLSGWDPIVTGASFAFLGHLLTDQVVNPVVPLGYFFSFRAAKRFRRQAIVKSEWGQTEEDFLRLPVTKKILSVLNPRIKK